jgi:mannose/fructose/N-acetylgalactosamine-specific phosphotransferase system component IIC
MGASFAHWLAAALCGALLALDHAAWPSLLLAQPLPAGAFAGWLAGRPEAGFAAGAIAQMLWIAARPVGGAVVAEAWLGGFAAALCAPPDIVLAGHAWLDDPRLAAPALVGVGAAAGGRWLLVAQRALVERAAARITPALERGDAGPAVRLHALGIGLHALRGATCVVAVAALAPSAARALDAIGVAAPAGRIALALAAASLATCAARRKRLLRVAVGATAGALVALLI